MSASPPAGPNPPQVVTIPVSGTGGIGNLSITPPTFLEKWGVIFVSVGGIWMLAVCVALLWYYLTHLSTAPPLTPATRPDDYKAILDLHKAATDQFRDSLNFAFDLMITKTALPLITLLLGYLFGKKS
jgi:hypothetical protein